MRYPASILFCLALVAGACNLPSDLRPTLTALPGPTATEASQWEKIEEGLEWRALRPNGDELSQLVVLRIDPQYFRFRAVYRPGEPLSLADWRQLEPAASVLINANFFDGAYRALGAVVSDGLSHGLAYADRGGTFLVRDGAPSVVSFRSGPPLLDHSVEQAIQGFPLLVFESEQAYFGSPNEERNRRTVIAEDANGNILIIVAPFFGLSLAELSAFLPTANLDIVTAINLDGGGSTMIAIPAADYFQPSFDTVPLVLAVYRR
ncbi:MAG: phosphodiester glycosidase family protein [Chloroflexi bacterium]|nr:phosphodiester glycosidase family protein [Chloroflexota bacterium]